MHRNTDLIVALEKLDLVIDGREHQIEYLEGEVRSALAAIHKRSAALLEALSETPIHAVRLIAGSAGASGPIGSQFEKALAAAAKLEMIVEMLQTQTMRQRIVESEKV